MRLCFLSFFTLGLGLLLSFLTRSAFDWSYFCLFWVVPLLIEVTSVLFESLRFRLKLILPSIFSESLCSRLRLILLSILFESLCSWLRLILPYTLPISFSIPLSPWVMSMIRSYIEFFFKIHHFINWHEILYNVSGQMGYTLEALRTRIWSH